MSTPAIRVAHTTPTEIETPLLVLQHFEDDDAPRGAAAAVDEATDGLLGRVLESGDFRGQKEETLVVYPQAGVRAERVLLVGIGKREEFAAEGLRRAVGAAVRAAERMTASSIAFALGHADRKSERMGPLHAGRAAAEGAVLAAWSYRELKSEDDDGGPRVPLETVTLLAGSAEDVAALETGAELGRVVARAENLARELAAKPGNIATPTHLAEVARGIAGAGGLDATILDRAAIVEEGMNALLAVASGSEQEPRFIVLEHRGAGDDAPWLALVGKGVTFDSGGISIKPSRKMEEMKYDMSGAAAVLGAMQAIPALGIEANVVGIVPSTENLPSGTAVKPGDVIRSHSGKTIEIINTDAEGRLILADALSYAQRYTPAAMINVATLTGAVVTALGHHAVGLMGNDGDLMDEVRAVGERVGQRCWPLPLWDPYRKQLDSDVADIMNSGGRPAGSITAGWFLKEFVRDVPWAHLDIAGTAYLDEPPPYLRKGPTGVPTRLFVEWVRGRAGG